MMLPARPAGALRRRRLAALALACSLAALMACARLALASASAGGQIVWSANNGIWVMNEDGTDPRRLISAASPALTALLPSGTLAAPDVFQNGGTSVLFLGLTSSFAPPALPAACGADCSGTFELSGGKLTELGPPAAAAAAAAYYESEPRITADAQELFDSTLYTGILASSVGTPATALVERPLKPNATVTQWSNTNGETVPASGFDPAPDPADPTLAAWVESQGCGYLYPNAQNVQQSSCQYAIHFGAGSDLSAPVVIYDNEFVAANGHGPTSLALSSDGTTLLLVDPSAPKPGIYTTAVAGAPGQKTVTEVLAQPAGWSFGQARFAGTKIVFDAHQQIGGKTTGDIYTIPASCSTANGCTFPAGATNLTNDAPADSSDPAWTSATTPLAALAGAPRITSVIRPAAPVRVGRRFTLVVKLSASATIVVRFARRLGTAPKYKAIGSITAAGRAGANRLSVGLVAGRTLPVGSYTATIALQGSSAAPRTAHFSVRP